MTTYTRPRNARLRTQVFAHYGERCACCGATKRLSIDHIGGDGKHHRTAIGIGRSTEAMYRWLIANGFPDGFQTLCVPCNKSKGAGERCIIDHASGRTTGMTSAERSLRWRERQGTGRQSVSEHAALYPEESRKPHRRCPYCGRFLRWDDYYGRYGDHLSYDGETWEPTCL